MAAAPGAAVDELQQRLEAVQHALAVVEEKMGDDASGAYHLAEQQVSLLLQRVDLDEQRFAALRAKAKADRVANNSLNDSALRESEALDELLVAQRQQLRSGRRGPRRTGRGGRGPSPAPSALSAPSPYQQLREAGRIEQQQALQQLVDQIAPPDFRPLGSDAAAEADAGEDGDGELRTAPPSTEQLLRRGLQSLRQRHAAAQEEMRQLQSRSLRIHNAHRSLMEAEYARPVQVKVPGMDDTLKSEASLPPAPRRRSLPPVVPPRKSPVPFVAPPSRAGPQKMLVRSGSGLSGSTLAPAAPPLTVPRLFELERQQRTSIVEEEDRGRRGVEQLRQQAAGLRRLASSDRPAVAADAQLLVDCLTQHLHDLPTAIRTLHITAAVLADGRLDPALLWAKQAIPSLIEALRAHPNEGDVVLPCLAILTEVVTPQSAGSLDRPGAVRALVNVLRNHTIKAELVTGACRVLTLAAEGTAHCRQAVVAEGALPAVLQILLSFRDDPDTLAAAFHVLRGVAHVGSKASDEQFAVMRCGVLPLLAQAVAEHPAHRPLLSATAGLVGNLGRFNPLNREELVRAGWVAALLELLLNSPTDPGVVLQALNAFAAISCSADGADECAALDVQPAAELATHFAAGCAPRRRAALFAAYQHLLELLDRLPQVKASQRQAARGAPLGRRGFLLLWCPFEPPDHVLAPAPWGWWAASQAAAAAGTESTLTFPQAAAMPLSICMVAASAALEDVAAAVRQRLDLPAPPSLGIYLRPQLQPDGGGPAEPTWARLWYDHSFGHFQAALKGPEADPPVVLCWPSGGL